MTRHVVFFDDTAVVGGHQLSAVTAARLLQKTHRVTFIAASDRLAALLREAGVPVVPVAPPPRLHAVRAMIGGGGEVRRLLRELHPGVVVAVQGNILLATRGIQAARRERIRAVSFIPMALGEAVTARDRLWAAVGRYWYGRPDAFITTSRTAAAALRRSGVRAPVHLAYYGPDLSALPPVARTPHPYTIAIIGRVVFSHKGHDVLLRALPLIPEARLLVVGDGPDDARLDALARELNVAARIERLPWTDDVAAVYARADLIALPSRFEGLPLVMLEAMYYRLPIAASAVDGMLEVLPPDWLFPAGDAEALARTVQHLRTADVGAAVERNYRRIVEEMNAARFAEAFVAGLG